MIDSDDILFLKHKAATARNKAQRFAQAMAECAAQPFFRDAGVALENSAGKDILLALSTPTSLGRLRAAWAGSPKDLVGVLVVERVQLDKYDRDRWDTVLSIGLHDDGRVSFHSALEGLVESALADDDEAKGGPWEALMLAVYYLSRFSDLR